MIKTGPSEIQLKLGTYRSAQAIEKFSEARAAQIILHIARIEMVGDIENDYAHPRFLVEVRNSEAL